MLLRLLRLLPLLLLAAVGSVRAQAYEPGYLVRASGDTLRGELENGFWLEAPTFVRYRPTAASPSELFPARQLRAFGFAGGRCFRHEVLRLDRAAETRLQELQRGNYVRMSPDSVLAEVLLTGPAELLRVVRPGAVHYEMRRPGQPPLSLSERKFLRETDRGAWQVVDGNNYHSQLDLYFIDCPAARQAAATAAFTAQGLVAVVQAYATSCTPAGQPARSWLAHAAPRRRGAFQAGVLAGVRYNRIESASYLVAGCTGCQVVPFGGLYAELLQPSRTTSFYGELSVSTFHNETAQFLGYDRGQTVFDQFAYHGVLGTARLGVRYLRPLANDRQLILGLGYEYNTVWGLATDNAAQANYLRTDYASDYYPGPTLLPNFTLGWRQQRLTILLDGQVYHNINDTGLSSVFFGSNWSTRLGVSYRLGRNPDKPHGSPATQP